MISRLPSTKPFRLFFYFFLNFKSAELVFGENLFIRYGWQGNSGLHGKLETFFFSVKESSPCIYIPVGFIHAMRGFCSMRIFDSIGEKNLAFLSPTEIKILSFEEIGSHFPFIQGKCLASNNGTVGSMENQNNHSLYCWILSLHVSAETFPQKAMKFLTP